MILHRAASTHVGVDLHARALYTCGLNADGEIMLHLGVTPKNLELLSARLPPLTQLPVPLLLHWEERRQQVVVLPAPAAPARAVGADLFAQWNIPGPQLLG